MNSFTPVTPERRLIVAVDMARYSHQDNLTQYESQRAFQGIMAQAVTEVGLDRSYWRTQPGGDGELAILPVGTPEPTVVSGLVSALDRLLRGYNRQRVSTSRIRLRVAVHQGLVHLDGAAGFPGDAVVTAARLVDAPQLKQALVRFPDASVALIVSAEIYDDVVRHHYAGLRPDRFSEVVVAHPDKGFTRRAWIFVPDENANGPRADGPEMALDSPSAGVPRHAARPPSTPRSAHTVPVDTFHFSDLRTYGPTAVGTNASAHGDVHFGQTDNPQ